MLIDMIRSVEDDKEAIRELLEGVKAKEREIKKVLLETGPIECLTIDWAKLKRYTGFRR